MEPSVCTGHFQLRKPAKHILPRIMAPEPSESRCCAAGNWGADRQNCDAAPPAGDRRFSWNVFTDHLSKATSPVFNDDLIWSRAATVTVPIRQELPGRSSLHCRCVARLDDGQAFDRRHRGLSRFAQRLLRRTRVRHLSGPQIYLDPPSNQTARWQRDAQLDRRLNRSQSAARLRQAASADAMLAPRQLQPSRRLQGAAIAHQAPWQAATCSGIA